MYIQVCAYMYSVVCTCVDYVYTQTVIAMSTTKPIPPYSYLQQVSFWVASPSLPLRIYGKGGRVSLDVEDKR